MPPKREIQVRFLLAVPTPALFASQRGLFFCHAPNSPTPNSMTRPFRPSCRPSAQDANGSSFAPIPTPRGSRHVAPSFNAEPGQSSPLRPLSHAAAARRHDQEAKPLASLGGGARLRAEKIVGWAQARFLPPLFFTAPLFIHSSAPPASFCWTLRVGPSTGDAFRGSARQGSSDGKMPSADHRSGPTSWRKASARQSGRLCKPTTQTNAANQAALGQGRAAMAIPGRSAPAAGVRRHSTPGGLLQTPMFSDSV